MFLGLSMLCSTIRHWTNIVTQKTFYDARQSDTTQTLTSVHSNSNPEKMLELHTLSADVEAHPYKTSCDDGLYLRRIS